MKKSRLTETFALIEKLRPMILIDDLDEYEKNHHLGRFDVMFKQKDDRKTIWGDSQMRYDNVTLRSLADDIYDNLYHNYEVWIRESPEIENGPTKISDENIRYAISLEADNLAEDMAPLDCRMVGGWLVMSGYYDATFDEQKKFFVEFGYTEPFKLGPSQDDADILFEKELDDLAEEKIKTFTILSVQNKNSHCIHCTEENSWAGKNYKIYANLHLDDQHNEVLELEKECLNSKKQITKDQFQERMDKILGLKKKIEQYISERDDALSFTAIAVMD